jgi:hypothetical protein
MIISDGNEVEGEPDHMASEFLICPNCKTRLNKPVQYQVMGDIGSAGGSFIGLGGDDTLPCSACGFRMKKMDIIAGKFDPTVSKKGMLIAAIVAVAVIGFLLYQCSSG